MCRYAVVAQGPFESVYQVLRLERRSWKATHGADREGSVVFVVQRVGAMAGAVRGSYGRVEDGMRHGSILARGRGHEKVCIPLV